jgi:hypothetical protein
MILEESEAGEILPAKWTPGRVVKRSREALGAERLLRKEHSG